MAVRRLVELSPGAITVGALTLLLLVGAAADYRNGAWEVAKGVMVCGSGALLLFVSCRPLVRGLASRRWPTVEGTIVRARVGAKWFYRASVLFMTYSYRVNGHDYIGTRYRQSEAPGDASVVRGTRTDWRPGEPVTVRYDPDRPELATIETGLNLDACLGELLLAVYAAYLFCAPIVGLTIRLVRALGGHP